MGKPFPGVDTCVHPFLSGNIRREVSWDAEKYENTYPAKYNFPLGLELQPKIYKRKKRGEKELSENMTGLKCLTAIILQSENKQICQSRQYNMSFYTCFSPYPKLLIISA